MKVRHGFVSNSSSSSFIIGLSPFIGGIYRDLSVFDVAKEMLLQREYENDTELVVKLKTLDIDKNHPLCFHSCNYDTFIVRRADGIYVSTCRNHDWERSDVLRDGEVLRDESLTDDVFAEMDNMEFYFLEYDVLVTRPDEYKSCSRCYQSLWMIDGVLQCALHKKDYEKEDLDE